MIKLFLSFSIFIVLNFLFGISVHGQENVAVKASALKTSYVSTWEKLNAINDGYEPQNSQDKGPGAYGNWNQAPNFNKWNWVEYDFSDFYLFNRSDVYWWTDGGGIQIPYQSYTEYWNIFSKEWEKPENVIGNGVLPDQYNTTTFSPVLTNKIRIYCISTAAQGILEWKVFGTKVDNVPVQSAAIADKALAPGVASVITLTAVNDEGIKLPGYNFILDVKITNKLSGHIEEYQIGDNHFVSDSLSIHLQATDENGQTFFSVKLPAEIDPTDGVKLTVKLDNGFTKLAEFNYFEIGMTPPVLVPDLIENDVDHFIELTFIDNPSWRGNISNVKVNDIVLGNEYYEILPGIVRLKPAESVVALTKAGTKNIVVEAAGYQKSSANQMIKAGMISISKSGIDSTIKIYRPSKTSVPVYALDAYGNPVAGYTFRYDIEVRNSDVTTNEEYLVNDVEISENKEGNSLTATDSNGKSKIVVTVPLVVDINDGILFKLKLQDNSTTFGSARGYIHVGKEKEVYLPRDVKSDKDFKWEQTAQSENFTAFWGSKSGPDPLNPPAGGLKFDPQEILNQLEYYYSFYIDSMKFILNTDSLNMGKYKFVIILFNTWKSGWNDNGAYGASIDDVIGAMWMNPQTGFVVAHEFGHACQAMIPIQYPGRGFKDKDDAHVVGMYWEACANYMAFLSSGQTANMLTPLFLNTSMLQYLSTIDYRQYESVYLPAYIIDKFGIEALGKQWRSALKGDNPFDAMMRGLGMTRDEMRREAGLWAMHNVTWDYSAPFRSYVKGLDPSAKYREFTYPETITGIPGTYIVPREMAPADYGYNIIPVFPDNGATSITAKLSGYNNDPAGGGGWSYGFVAVDAKGNPRYGQVSLESDEKATLNIEPTDSLFYLTVLASPQKTNTYAWTPAWPKVYRFPYSLQFENVVPAGHKDGYNSKKNSVPGAPHSNGGGWVASTASVDATAYVGPNAQVLGTAKVSGNARIEDFAVVSGSSQVKDNAIVRGNAIVGNAAIVINNALIEKAARVYNGKISGNGVVTGSAAAFNCRISDNAVVKDVAFLTGVTLSGTTIVGGDKNSFVACSDGIYLSLNQSKCDEKLWDPKNTEEINQVVEHYYYPYGDIPLAPENIQVTALSGSSVLLTWDKALDNGSITNYIVFQNGKPVSLAVGTSDTISGLKPETSYIFSLRARDNVGNISEISAEAEVKTLVSVDDIKSTNQFIRILPNPVRDSFIVEVEEAKNARLTISNLIGEIVYQNNFTESICLNKDVVGKNGIYFVKVDTGAKTFVGKLMVNQ
jgi:carbonic anhydrase/acetyltransferase-like protein (isoleucine patch superfamily)